MKRLLLFFISILTFSVSGAWAESYYFATGRTQVTSITSGKYYAIDGLNQQNGGTAGHFLFDNGTKVTSNNPQALPTDYTAEKFIWQIVGNSSDGWTLQNLATGNYMSLGSSDGSQISSSTTSQTNGIYFSGNYATILNSNGQAIDIGNQGNNPTTWSGSTTPEGSRRLVIYEVEVVEIIDDACYTIDFVSKSGTNTWGLKAGTTRQSPVADGTGDVFVAHSYTNTAGNKRWIFVNNSDGTYLAYNGDATSEFNLTYAIGEWNIASLTAGSGNVNSDSPVAGKLSITNDRRSTNNDSQGCYIVNESNGTYDNSSAPYYNGSFTSALRFTATGDAVSDAATLAIAKFDALYELKGYNYLTYAGNITALFASPSEAVTNINAASTTSGVTTAKENFMKSPEGKKFYAVASTATGQYLSVGESNVSATSTELSQDVVMEVEYAGNGKYYLKGVKSAKYAGAPANPPSTYSSSNDATAFYIGNYENTTDNKVYFAKTRTNSNDEAFHYHIDYTTYVTNWQYSSNPSQWIITAISDDDYTALGEAVDQTISYTLTDMNGATYSGTFTGKIYASLSKGDQPTLTGCDRYSLSNEVWDDENNTYTANITFPFPVSSNDVHNYTYISSFTGDNLYWISDGTEVKSVKVASTGYPTNADYQKYEWEIIPIFSSDAFTFKIKNRKTATYIYSPGTSGANNLELTAEGTALTYSSNRGGSWKINSTLYISRHNSTDNTMELGSWTDHGGVRCTFVERADFETLISNLSTAYDAFSPYRALVGSGLGQYSGATASAMTTAYDNASNALLSFTAAQLAEMTTTLGNPATKLTLNLPTAGKFYRFKGNTTGYYISNESELYQGTYYKLYKHTSEENKAIFYLENNNSNNYLLSYGSGLYNNTNKDGDWAWGKGLSNAKTVVFSEGNIGFYRIQSAGQIYFYDADNSLDRGTSDGHDRYKKWTIEEVTSLPITFKGKYASFYSPVDLTLPTGVKAYTGEVNGGWMTLTERDYVPANTGVILYFEDFSSETTKYFTIRSTVTPITGTALTGTVAAASCDENTKLVLGYENSAWGIYKYSGDTLGGFKAYMDIQGGGGIKGFVFSFDDATAIVSVLNGEQQQGECYDLSGRRVSKPTRGLYIVGGKKVMVK